MLARSRAPCVAERARTIGRARHLPRGLSGRLAEGCEGPSRARAHSAHPKAGMARRVRYGDLLSTAVVAAAVALGAGCGEGPGKPRPRIELVPCTVQGVRAQAKCGTVRVFEDRAKKGGRTIDLRVVVVPAVAASPKPDPVFFLAGGPGQAATQILPFSLMAADRLRETRDLVFVDQRGTGGSGALFCEVPPEDAPLAERFDGAFEPDTIERCREAQDVDLGRYGTSVAVDDLDDVREALGYEKINLWGTSYGTRMGLAYLRAHEGHVRTAVLDGVAPMSLYLPLSIAKDADRALERLFEDCAADPACAAAFPGLRDRFHAFVARLGDAPIVATVKHPVTGSDELVVLDRSALLSSLRGMLYSPELSALLPLAIDRAIAGDLGAFVAIATHLGGAMERSFATGMFLSVVCTEDVPLIEPGAIEREAAGTIFGPDAAREIARACALWPRGEVPPGFRDPVKSDVPVLLMSGALDPVTPPSWADDAKKGLSRGVHVVFGGTAHNAATTACARRVAAAFVERGSGDGLDAACAEQIPRPRFFTSFAGPP
jgi:pimeloyl-ACP methyl ester carboxylesterase